MGEQLALFADVSPSQWVRPTVRGACGRDPAAGPGSCYHWWESCPRAASRGCYQLWWRNHVQGDAA